MQGIEFRGKRLDNGDWVTGFYVSLWHNDDKSHYHAYIILVEMCLEIPPDPETNKIMVEVDPQTVGQYIGRNDRCGQKIYKGSRVIVEYGKWHFEPKGLLRQGVVIWDEKACAFKVLIDNSAVRVAFEAISTIEVIGHIYAA